LLAFPGAPSTSVILDVVTGKMDGLELLRCLRRQGCIPVLMPIARGDEEDGILALSLSFNPNSSDQRDAVRSSRPRAHRSRLTLSPISAQMQFPRWTVTKNASGFNSSRCSRRSRSIRTMTNSSLPGNPAESTPFTVIAVYARTFPATRTTSLPPAGCFSQPGKISMRNHGRQSTT